MPSHENNWSTGKIVLVSAGAGLVALLLLMLWLGFAFWSSFLWGLVVGAIVYIILTLNFAGQAGTGDGYSSHGAAPSSGTGAGTTGAGTTGAGKTGAAAPAASSGAAKAAPAASAATAAPSKDMPRQAEPAAPKAQRKADSTEGTDEGTKPAMLNEARASGADNLKEIKGVGPKMEQMLNAMGVYHFDQVAGWNADEVAWVDANLKGFKGRVSRDGWVDQAKILATGGETEFSKRVDKGGVY